MSLAVIAVSIGKVDGARASQQDDVLAVEEPLEIRLGGESLSITMRTPGDDYELAAGFLFSEGIIRNIAQVRRIGRPEDGDPNVVEVDLAEGSPVPVRAQRNFVMTSACGVCGKASLRDLTVNACPILPEDDIHVDFEMVHALPARLRQRQSVFDSTGGLHAAALFNLRGELVLMREDVGRHNAVDKLIGASLMGGEMGGYGCFNRSILLVSGRASFELVQKALMAGIPVLASVGAPSSLAVATAARSGMTLIGFLRNERFNIYTGSQRLAQLQLVSTPARGN